MSIADELIVNGWGQGQFYADDGAVCLAGAAKKAAGENFDLYSEWWDVLGRVIGCPGLVVCQWNDEPGRTFDEVLRVAKLADEILDAQRAEPTQPQ